MGREGRGGEVSKIGAQRSSKKPRPRVLIAPELWKLHPPSMALWDSSRGNRQEAGAQKPRFREYSDLQTPGGLPASAWMAKSDLSVLKSHLRVLTGARKE